jgi:prephenate dehydratase
VLFKALSCFALRDIDLTKIERRVHPRRALHTWVID